MCFKGYDNYEGHGKFTASEKLSLITNLNPLTLYKKQPEKEQREAVHKAKVNKRLQTTITFLNVCLFFLESLYFHN